MSHRTYAGPSSTGRRRRVAGGAVVLVSVFAVALSFQQPTAASTAPSAAPGMSALARGSYEPGELLVRFRPETTAATEARANAAMGATTIRSFSSLVPHLQLVKLRPSVSVAHALLGYSRMADVRYAQPNWVSRIDTAPAVGAAKTPNDPRYGEQWDWPKIAAPKAWNKTTGSRRIVVTDIDTGMDYTHPDLAANAWQNTAECDGKKGVDDDHNGYVDDCYGIDTVNGDSDPIDDNGHGTHTAGTIGAVGNNGVGVTGLNWKVQVMPCKSHSSAGVGTVASIIECYQYVKVEKVKYGYDIAATNNSYGGCTEACDWNPATYDAIKALIKPGVIMAFAAGNSARDNDIRPNYPSNYDLPNIIAVAATDSSDRLASFSQWGARSVDVGAPGVSVLSTYLSDGYANLSGTSMATPHVAALSALLHSFNSKLAWWQIRNLIIAGGDKIDALAGKTVSGRRINAAGSMNCSGRRVLGLLSPVANTGSGTQTVSALHVNCAKPAGAVSVKVTPGGATLKLADDGKGADLVAGDGVYAASWKAGCGGGPYTFALSGGASYPVNVVACAKLGKRSGPAGSKVAVTGTGYGAGEVVDIFFDHKLVDTVNASGSGRVSDTITVPAPAKAGKHTIVVSGQTSGVSANAVFTVT